MAFVCQKMCLILLSYQHKETSQTIPAFTYRNFLGKEIPSPCVRSLPSKPLQYIGTSCNVSKSKEGFGLRQQRQHVISTRHRMMMLSRASHHATKPDQNIPAPPPVIFSAHPEQERSHAIVSSISQQHSKHVKETHPLAAPGRAVLRHPSR